ncbi:Sel1 domain protein repeat-containing protein [Nitrosococcus watsonii C-113]|uniref:Sel1 domain protein repeat-containing protein n=2 Tax=Nitrosococcus TaxID=1227 RepID=D8K9T7_NITWC|nr:Sel1 domain protein repeat-containing protein [Nitrosococcus watsonii C-113]
MMYHFLSTWNLAVPAMKRISIQKLGIGLLCGLMLCAMLIACTQAPPAAMIRVCDSKGCSYRPSDSATYDSSAAVPDEDPEGRIAALEILAQRDPQAAYDLGLRFFRGDGVPQDSYRALKWMRSAAERGNLDAQVALGQLYLTGLEELGSDPREAEKWLSIAAGRGNEEAQTILVEAREARQAEDAYFKWRNRWQPLFYRRWYYNYPYRFYWRRGGWHHY